MDTDMLSQIIALTSDISTIAVLLFIIYRDDKKNALTVEYYQSMVSRFIDNIMNK